MKQNYILLRTMLIVSFLFAGVPFSQAEENSDCWEVQIIKEATNEIVRSGIAYTNSFSLEGLDYDVKYFAKIRTKNTFFSDWEISDVFILDEGSMSINPSFYTKGLLLSSNNGQLFISSELKQQVDVYSVDGCLLRSVTLLTGGAAVIDLSQGLYIVNGQKIVVK